jgi:pimeloyl-ACP methyl ester carboxylesterase
MLARWNVEIEQVDLETTCGTTHCVIAGDASLPPLLLFHGVGDNSAVMWVLNIGTLSKHFHCIAVDTLGGPGRSRPNEEYGRRFSLLEWQLEVLDALALQDTNVVGVSYGAYMTYNLCVKAPQRVRRAVCIEGGIVTSRLRPILNMVMFPEMLIPTQKNLSKVLSKMISPASEFQSKHPYIVDHMTLMMRAHNRRAMYVHKLHLYREEEGITQREKLLFLVGEYRMETKRHLLKPLQRGGYSYKIIAGAGHGLNHEQPEIADQQIIAFLE